MRFYAQRFCRAGADGREAIIWIRDAENDHAIVKRFDWHRVTLSRALIQDELAGRADELKISRFAEDEQIRCPIADALVVCADGQRWLEVEMPGDDLAESSRQVRLRTCCPFCGDELVVSGWESRSAGQPSHDDGVELDGLPIDACDHVLDVIPSCDAVRYRGPIELCVSDEDCVVDETGVCRLCSVGRGEPCADCGGRSYHKETCNQPIGGQS